MMSGAVAAIASMRKILPLDAIPSSNVAAAIALRKLRTLYTGYAIKARRSSDNAETDVSYDNNGLITAASIVAVGGTLGTWMGTDSVFVSSCYDQSGLGNHATQATLANQPRIANAGVFDTLNNRLSFMYLGSQKLGVTDNASIELDSNLTAFFVYKATGWGAVAALLDKRTTTGSTPGYHIYIQNNVFGIQWNTTAASTVQVTPINNLNVLYAFNMSATKASTVKLYNRLTNVNSGTLTATGSSINNVALLIGGHSTTATLNFQGYFGEFILLNTVPTDQQRAAIVNNQVTYFGF